MYDIIVWRHRCLLPEAQYIYLPFVTAREKRITVMYQSQRKSMGSTMVALNDGILDMGYGIWEAYQE